MKIALVHNFSVSKNTGGAERTAFRILEHLHSSSFEVVYCTLAEGSSLMRSRLLANGIRHYELPRRNPFRSQDGALNKLLFHFFEIFNCLSFIDFWKLAKNERFRFIFFHNPKGFSFGIWLCAILQKIPFCLVHHDYYNICINSCFFKKDTGTCKSQCLSCRTAHFIPWLLHFFSDFAIFLSFNQKRIFNKAGWFLRKKSFIIPPQIRLPDKRKKFSLSKKVGFIGRLDATKGVDDFLSLCRQCHTLDIMFYIQAFRNDPHLERYKLQAKDLKNLKWVHKNNFIFLREMDFIVVPSKWEEPFGRVYLEALSCGTPCIGYPKGAIRDIMTGELSVFITEECEALSIKKKLVFLYARPSYYRKYSALCLKQFSLFKSYFLISMRNAIKRI